MNDDQIKIENEKNEYLFKILYLIRTNLPTNEIIYIIMFLFKYIGLILFSISLNQFKINKNNNTEKSYNIIYYFFSKFIINGNDLKILVYNYQEICIIGFEILIFFIIFVIFGVFYVKKNIIIKILLVS